MIPRWAFSQYKLLLLLRNNLYSAARRMERFTKDKTKEETQRTKNYGNT